MDFDAWTKLLGKSQSDGDLTTALEAVGIKKIPKPKFREGESFVQLELKGRGLEVILTDEASLKEQDDKLGKGPLIFSGVLAKVGKVHGRDLYKGALPSGITGAMSRDAVRKILGKPKESHDRVDIWKKGGRELCVNFAKSGELSAVSVMLPNATA